MNQAFRFVVAKRPKTEVPDSPQEVAYVGYIIDSSKEGVVLEPKHSIRLVVVGWGVLGKGSEWG